MAFKSLSEYNNDRYGGMFLLKNDGDSADVIFMYRSIEDVLVADTHYIKSDKYNGYVQCLGGGSCPACSKGIRVQPKLFIPVYVLSSEEILFWDRSIRFQQTMENDVFSKFDNPSEFVFRITRRGAAGDINTRYSIQAIAKNTVITYDEILAKCNATMPDYYNTICKDWTAEDYDSHLTPSPSNSIDADMMPEYKLSPRGNSNPVVLPQLADEDFSLPEDVNF